MECECVTVTYVQCCSACAVVYGTVQFKLDTLSLVGTHMCLRIIVFQNLACGYPCHSYMQFWHVHPYMQITLTGSTPEIRTYTPKFLTVKLKLLGYAYTYVATYVVTLQLFLEYLCKRMCTDH